MEAKDLTLNIAVNLGRLSRFAIEGKKSRIEQFLIETEEYVEELERAKRNPRFEKTFVTFKYNFSNLKKNIALTDEWAEQALTWANILTHRAKLASL